MDWVGVAVAGGVDINELAEPCLLMGDGDAVVNALAFEDVSVVFVAAEIEEGLASTVWDVDILLEFADPSTKIDDKDTPMDWLGVAVAGGVDIREVAEKCLLMDDGDAVVNFFALDHVCVGNTIAELEEGIRGSDWNDLFTETAAEPDWLKGGFDIFADVEASVLLTGDTETARARLSFDTVCDEW